LKNASEDQAESVPFAIMVGMIFSPTSVPGLSNRNIGSFAQLLMKVARLFNEEVLARIRRERPHFAQVRLAHLSLLLLVSAEGTRITELARRTGTSKQAVGQLVDELVREGFLIREQDPTDRRAKRVRCTEKGEQGLLDTVHTLAAIEHELADPLDSTLCARLLFDLTGLLTALERLRAADGSQK
jgi:DNA-binding MarR family transcriptional regulator